MSSMYQAIQAGTSGCSLHKGLVFVSDLLSIASLAYLCTLLGEHLYDTETVS